MKTETTFCDRCGKKIKNTISPFCHVRKSVTLQYTDYKTLANELQNEKAIMEEGMKFGAVRIELEGSYYEKCRRYDLCRDCSSDFLSFMRNQREV